MTKFKVGDIVRWLMDTEAIGEISEIEKGGYIISWFDGYERESLYPESAIAEADIKLIEKINSRFQELDEPANDPIYW